MRTDTENDEFQERAALYALGSLSQIEARAFEDHLKECPDCRAELESYSAVAGILGLDAAPSDPPLELADKLAERIKSDLKAPRTPTALRPTPISAGRAPFSVKGRFVPWAVAACVALFAAAALLGSWRERDGLKRQLTTSQELTADLSNTLAREHEMAVERAAMLQALESPESQLISLSSTQPKPEPHADIAWDKQRRRWLIAANLAPAPKGKVYQLWFITRPAPALGPVSAGLIATDSAGRGFARVDIPPSIDHIEAAAITLEPAGGSATPTMPTYVFGKVQ